VLIRKFGLTPPLVSGGKLLIRVCARKLIVGAGEVNVLKLPVVVVAVIAVLAVAVVVVDRRGFMPCGTGNSGADAWEGASSSVSEVAAAEGEYLGKADIFTVPLSTRILRVP